MNLKSKAEREGGRDGRRDTKKGQICRGHIPNGMVDSPFDVYQYLEFVKELWKVVEGKYMAVDATSKKFLLVVLMTKNLLISPHHISIP